MGREKEREVEVLNDGKKVKILVKRPSGAIQSKGGRIAAKIWTECTSDGIMTKQELSDFMKERNIWNKEKDLKETNLTKEIAELEKKLAFGTGRSRRMKKSEGKQVAIEIRQKRAELRDLIGERLALEGNTAEALSDNAKFDYFVATCTYYKESGEKVYNSLEEYEERSDDDLAFAAANAMAQMLYSLDKDFEKALPENSFLNKYSFTNEEGSLINNEGKTVDLEGRIINELGHYLNDKGERIDVDGNLLDEDGRYISNVEYVDDEEEGKDTAKQTETATKTTKTKTKTNGK